MANEMLIDYINEQVERRGWTYAELARRASVSTATISEVLSGRKNAGVDLCKGLGYAFGEPAETIMRIAGILPLLTSADQYTETANALFRELPESARPHIIQAMRGIIEGHKVAVKETDD